MFPYISSHMEQYSRRKKIGVQIQIKVLLKAQLLLLFIGVSVDLPLSLSRAVPPGLRVSLPM